MIFIKSDIYKVSYDEEYILQVVGDDTFVK